MSEQHKSASVDWNTVLRYLAGGSLVGGGAGAATSVLRYLNTLKERANTKPDSSLDDDVLYVNLPASHPGMAASAKQASKDNANTASTFAMSNMAGLAGLVGAYQVVRNVYSKLRKNQLQGQLDQAQQAYLGGLGQSAAAAKSAAHHQFGMLSKGIGSAYLMGLLSILGSAVVTNKVLQKHFPPIKSPLRGRPRKIVVRSVDPETQQPVEDAGMDKTIPVEPDQANPEEMEHLLRQNTALNKTAGHKSPLDMDDLIAAVAQGRGGEITQALEQGLDAQDVLDLVKGAAVKSAAKSPDRLSENLAIGWIAHDPLVSQAFAPLIAAEFAHYAPGYCKMANGLDADEQLELSGLVHVLNQEMRGMIFAPLTGRLDGQVKSAAARGEDPLLNNPIVSKLILASALRSLLGNNMLGQEAEPAGDQGSESDQASRSPDNELQRGLAATTSSQDSAQAMGDTHRHGKNPQPTFEVDDPQAQAFVAKNKDAIDAALARSA